MAEKVFTSMGASLNGGNFLMPQEKWRKTLCFKNGHLCSCLRKMEVN